VDDTTSNDAAAAAPIEQAVADMLLKDGPMSAREFATLYLGVKRMINRGLIAPLSDMADQQFVHAIGVINLDEFHNGLKNPFVRASVGGFDGGQAH